MATTPFLDAVRGAALDARTAMDIGVGARAYAVTLAHETATLAGVPCALGTPGATYVVTTLLSVSPQPRVVPVDADVEPSWLGGGIVAQSTGRNGLDSLLIGPITQDCSAGGYTAVQLSPATNNPTERYVYVVAGPGLETLAAYGGVPYEIRRLSQPTQQRHMIHATRTQVYP